ncbi:MAG: ligase-associated DNA damage response endonuclease PdeM [Gemmatimonadota bacterium]
MTAATSAPRELSLVVCGSRVVLRGDRSLFWPELGWLIVADLHLGKAESLRRDGVALPDGVMAADLQRLQLAVAETGAARVLVLGDLVHDAAGLTAAMVRRVAAWREGIPSEIALVPGNHDRRVAELPASWRVRRLDELLRVDPFLFSHEPQRLASAEAATAATAATAGMALFNWHGHVHPVLTVRGGVDRARLPCFVVDHAAGILPAFSTLTGGSECSSGDSGRRWGIVEGRILEIVRRPRGEG